MKKIYLLLNLAILFLISGQAFSQVLVPQNFEEESALSDFSEWTTGLPPFILVQADACEGTNTLQVDMHSGAPSGWLQYNSQPVEGGFDIEVSVDYKVVDNAGGFTTGDFGTIDLQYSTDGGTTWVSYDTIDQTSLPTSDCSTHTATIPSSNFQTGDNFAWRADVNWNQGDYFVYIDNFLAVEQVNCIEPIYLSYNEASLTANSVSVNWDELNAGVTEWEVAYCITPTSNPDPTNPLFCDFITVNGSPNATLTNLTAGTPYYVYVRSVCSSSSESEWAGPLTFNTIAIGSSCANPIDINNDPNSPVVGDLPYSNSSQTDPFGNMHTSGDGVNCGTAGNVLNGYEVVYRYKSYDDDILTIDLTGISSTNTAVLVYESCDDIGDTCIASGYSGDGSPININSLFVDQGQDYYIVVASGDTNFNPENTPYTIDIEGFDCASWEGPSAPASIEFVGGQTLADFNYSQEGADVTIDLAELIWYEDNNGAPGNEITSPLSSIILSDQDTYWVTQFIGTCESPAVQINFTEFDCDSELGGIASTNNDEYACGSGSVTLEATAPNLDNIYWFDASTDGNIVGTGATFDTPNISETTSYWVSEAFSGETTISNQGNPGPNTSDVSSSDYGVEFTAGQAITIVSVSVYALESGVISLELTDGGSVIKSDSFTVNGNANGTPHLNTIILNWRLPSDGTYELVKASGDVDMLYTSSSDASYPYPLSYLGEVASSGGTSNGNYYYFYNWTIRGEVPLCESPRVQVDAIVEEIIPTTVSADDDLVCVGSSTDLHVSSTNDDYTYTWSWLDGNGNNTDTGETISVTLLEDTTYTVTAIDTVTGCEFENEILVEVRGVGEIPLTPDNVQICIGEVVSLSSGNELFDFEETDQEWTTVNNSVDKDGNAVNSASWQMVTSPYSPAGGVASNDNSNFYLSNGDSVGPEGVLDASLVSPSFNLVGLTSLELNFYHYFKYITTQSTSGSFQVSVNQEAWQTVETYTSTIGSQTNFIQETINLDDYVGNSNVRIRFNHSGGWGWYWAIDNVMFSKVYADGAVSWTPIMNLYADEDLTTPYDGSQSSQVYFSSSEAGQYDYTATLNVLDCESVDAQLTINVTEAVLPTGDSEQFFEIGDVIGDLNVTGQNLKWYILNNNGEYERVTINFLLENEEVYYVSQTINGCESELLEITTKFDCPEISGLSINMQSNADGTVDGVLIWDEPVSTISVQDYHIIIYDSNGDMFAEYTVNGGETFVIIENMPKDSGFEAEVYTICTDDIFSESVFFEYETLFVENQNFESLSFYPNPTDGVVNFKNSLLIDNIKLYSLTGQLLLSKNIQNKEASINISEMASGVYFVNIQVDQATKVVKIIKD